MNHLLYAMEHQRTTSASDIQQTLNPKHLRAVPVEQTGEPYAEGAPIDGLFNS